MSTVDRGTERERLIAERIVANPKVDLGAPLLKSTGASVKRILERLGDDLDFDGVYADFPGVTREDVRACILYAAGKLRAPWKFTEEDRERYHKVLAEVAEVWADVDTDALIAELYRARRAGIPDDDQA